MNRLRRFCAAFVLLFALALSTSAGDIHCGAVPPPPEKSTAVMGEMTTGATATSSDENLFIDPVTGLALDILQSLLSLF